ncbi:MAG: helix-turn-helix domain-containing protein [Hormoscilla sp. GUM202]|nr:helix-turn-helix domain-containing protein [Hormoscilla sp. GUM202]
MKEPNSSVTVSTAETHHSGKIGVAEAAHRLGVSAARVRALLGQGRIEGARKQGRKWQIPTRGGMPKIIPGQRCPKGDWYVQQRTQNGFIHANQQVLRQNRKDAGSRPAIGVKLGKHSEYCHYVEIGGRSRLVYSPTEPTWICRARLWMEVDPSVPVAGGKFQTPGDRSKAVGVQEAAYLLGVCLQRVRQLHGPRTARKIGQGRIAGACKVSRRWRIPLGASGLPEVSAGSRGPEGTWRRPPLRKTIILINQKKIRANAASNSRMPVIDIFKDGTVCRCHEVEIMGPSRILYRPDRGGSHSLWIEADRDVEVVAKMLADSS